MRAGKNTVVTVRGDGRASAVAQGDIAAAGGYITERSNAHACVDSRAVALKPMAMTGAEIYG